MEYKSSLDPSTLQWNDHNSLSTLIYSSCHEINSANQNIINFHWIEGKTNYTLVYSLSQNDLLQVYD